VPRGAMRFLRERQGAVKALSGVGLRRVDCAADSCIKAIGSVARWVPGADLSSNRKTVAKVQVTGEMSSRNAADDLLA